MSQIVIPEFHSAVIRIPSRTIAPSRRAARLARTALSASSVGAGKLSDQASSLGLVLRTGFGQLAQAVARQGGSPGDAAKHAVNAAESFAKAGDRVDAGRAHLLAGVLLGEAGDTERAREEIAQARALFSACGANLFQSMAVREERRLNARGPRRRDAHTGELTRRELEVARLAGTGLTNRQIASELFVSPRTVEVHLSRILAKLDVPTRAAIAGALAGSGGDK